MPKPRKPTNVLAIRGTFKHDPARGRARENEPKPVGPIGDPPDDLTPEVLKAWVDLVTHAHAGTLCSGDRLFMVYAAGVWAQLREQIIAGDGPDPKLGVRFESIIGRLGMTPADRSKVQVIQSGEAKSPLAEFVA